jgi:ABC-type uncharacterized transport system auxiliary subunit
VFGAEVRAGSADVAAVNRAFESGLGDVTAALIGWTLAEGRRDTNRGR